jgi:uncharacterized Tic20 family protein
MNITEELNKLQELRDKGALSDEEYAKAKAAILNPMANQPSGSSGVNMSPERMAEQERVWGMLMHFALLLNILGVIVAVAIWQIKKTELPGIDAHGKNAVNWAISELVYILISGLLCVVGIGFLMLFALMIIGIVFPLIAGIKANNGQVWKYPLAITFIH